MSKVELNTPLVNYMDSFMSEQKAYLRPERKRDDLFKPSKDQLKLTLDEEELYTMYIEDSVRFELCK